MLFMVNGTTPSCPEKRGIDQVIFAQFLSTCSMSV
jgi:hypothetical protein